MIAVLAALDRELLPIVERMAVSDSGTTDSGHRYWRGRLAGADVAAVRTDVGPERARAAAQTTLDLFRPRLVVSIGYAGGLTDSLGPAHLVVADGAMRGGRRKELSVEWAERAAAIAAELGIPHQRGWLLTVDKPLVTPESKRQAYEQRGAIAVDMETAEVADVCIGRGVKCLALRAISDTASQSLEVAGKCVVSRRGFRAWMQMALHLMRRPRHVSHAFRLHRQGGKSSQHLLMMVDALVAASA